MSTETALRAVKTKYSSQNFGAVGALEPEEIARPPSTAAASVAEGEAIGIAQWLGSFDKRLEVYASTFIDEGYEDTSLLPKEDEGAVEEIMEALDSAEPPIKKGHRRIIKAALRAGDW